MSVEPRNVKANLGMVTPQAGTAERAFALP